MLIMRIVHFSIQNSLARLSDLIKGVCECVYVEQNCGVLFEINPTRYDV